MPEKEEKRLKRFKTGLKQLIEKAKEDEIITEEEAKIIEIAENNIKEYETVLNKALEDGLIDQEERNNLIALEEKLMEETYFQAINDNILDDDEILLLKTLYKAISPRSSVSWLDNDENRLNHLKQ